MASERALARRQLAKPWVGEQLRTRGKSAGRRHAGLHGVSGPRHGFGSGGPVTRDLRRAFRSEGGGTLGAVIDDSHEQPWRGAENLPRLRAACEGTCAHYQTALAAQNLRGADFAENWQICGQDVYPSGAPDWCSQAGQLMRGLNGAGEGR